MTPSSRTWTTTLFVSFVLAYLQRPDCSVDCFSPALTHYQTAQRYSRAFVPSTRTTSARQATTTDDLETKSSDLQKSLEACQKDLAKTCKVKVAPTNSRRLGLVATQSIKKGDVVLAMPYDDQFVLTADLARKTVFVDVLPEEYDSWTADTGLIALLILNEVALASGKGGSKVSRPPKVQDFMTAWVKSLPSAKEMIQQQMHPLLWSEDDQELLQSSSTNKIYRKLDDLEEDLQWLQENVFGKHVSRFPDKVPSIYSNEDDEMDCFNVQGFTWALALAQSRVCFVDGQLRLIPFLDMCNHNDDDAMEIEGGFMGTFGTTKGAQLVSDCSYQEGDEVFCSYGPKSAADYLLEHGFVPDACWKTAVSELTFELDAEKDRFYEDKLDILEFETYDQAPMDPVQSFDVVSGSRSSKNALGDGEPDPAMIQFVRLCQLGGSDAFLLESIFRKEVWGFMALPVSESNELAVVNCITEACQKALDDMSKVESSDDGEDEDITSPKALCAKLAASETKALTRTMEYLQREKEALDLKEYYQERRLKDLGLDSEWSPEDDVGGDDDLGFGQTRAPGGADYDW